MLLDRNTALKIVSDTYPDLDKERKNDVAKMLHVTAKRMCVDKLIESNVELKEYVHRRMKNKMNLVPISNDKNFKK